MCQFYVCLMVLEIFVDFCLVDFFILFMILVSFYSAA